MHYYKELAIHTKLPEIPDILNYFEISPTTARLQRYPYVTIWAQEPSALLTTSPGLSLWTDVPALNPGPGRTYDLHISLDTQEETYPSTTCIFTW